MSWFFFFAYKKWYMSWYWFRMLTYKMGVLSIYGIFEHTDGRLKSAICSYLDYGIGLEIRWQ